MANENQLDNKRARLLNGLAKITFDGRAKWEDTSEDDTFVARVGSSVIRIIDNGIKEAVGPLSSSRCQITIYDNNNKTVDSFNVSVDPVNRGRNELQKSVMNLRRAVASSFDEATAKRLDAILNEIGA